MNRFEFVNRLNGKLYLLKDNERRDIIDEYVGHINMKMKEGKSEAEAIKDFGDVDELAHEILSAYHIDSTKIENKTLDIYVRQFFDYFSKTAEKILSFSTAQMARVFVEFVVLLIILNVLRYPVVICGNIFAGLFSWLPYSVYHIIQRLTELLANIICIAFSLMFIYHFINSRVINAATIPCDERTDNDKNSMSDGDIKKDAIEKVDKAVKELKKESEDAATSIKSTAVKTGVSFKNSIKKLSLNIKKVTEGTGDFVINLAVLLIRIMIVLCVWIPCAALAVAAIVCTLLAVIVFMSTGIGFIGICIAGAGCCVIFASLTVWLTKMLAGGKAENA